MSVKKEEGYLYFMSVSNSVTRIVMYRKVKNLLTAAFVLFSHKMLWAQKEKCKFKKSFINNIHNILFTFNSTKNLGICYTQEENSNRQLVSF